MRPNKILGRIAGGEFLSATAGSRRVDIAICTVALHPAANRLPLCEMRRWRSTMRELSAEARLHRYARSLSGRAGRGLHLASFYGAFALIAVIVFGTLSVHPF
jgi:Flp pilus assembly protein TadB